MNDNSVESTVDEIGAHIMRLANSVAKEYEQERKAFHTKSIEYVMVLLKKIKELENERI